MYTTRPLSQLLNSPDSLLERPEGQNSGFLVIQDEEPVTYSCFGLHKDRTFKDLPFPQNKELTVRFIISTGQTSVVILDPVILIPVINHPLSSNLYYAIKPQREHMGEAFTSSTEGDKVTSCFGRRVKDVKPKPLDPHNVYQQFQIVPHETLCNSRGGFFAKSTAEDGFPPRFLRRKGWAINTKTPHEDFKLTEARGVNSTLRARLPQLIKDSEQVVVGKWYCPFMFVKEGALKDQMKRSVYYEISLEQRWEKIFSYRKNNQEKSVVIDSVVDKEEVFIDGTKSVWSEKNVVDGVIWFTSSGGGGANTSVGLRREIVDRMKWEQERVGFEAGGEREVKINRVEEFKGVEGWSELGCYVLVERFNLKRMDGSLVMAYDFKHCHQIKVIWE